MSNSIPKLEGEIVKRTLQFFWLVDCSGSMEGVKIASLNQAIRECLGPIRGALAAHPEVQLMMRAIKFSDKAEWHIGPQAIPLEQIAWPELNANGTTATSMAVNMLCDELDLEKMGRRCYPPVCILMSDGYCTEPETSYDNAINRLNSIPWGKKAVRLSIGIGKDFDEEELLKFTNHKEIGVLRADTSSKLAEYIKWASVTASVSSSVSKPMNDSSGKTDGESNVIISAPPAFDISDSSVVF